ncbi:DnaJ domain-containing protein [Astrocystis sublimbata]|nr:DnaJ domain-containing protein [Astrocystis sublimbata]
MADHYAVLEIQQTASNAEINSAYYRLARIHHPDKNLHNVEEATERFKKIQNAHAILSDETKRCQYDIGRATASSFADTGGAGSGAGATRDDEPPDEFIFVPFEFMFPPRFVRNWQEWAWGVGGERRDREPEQERWDRRMEEIYQERAERQQDVQRKEEERAAAKQAQKDASDRERRNAMQREAAQQEARWQREGATTFEAKASTCLHSAFCIKNQLRKKVRCHACGFKRGVTEFECPHCARHICQKCITDFAAKRKAVDSQDESSVL